MIELNLGAAPAVISQSTQSHNVPSSPGTYLDLLFKELFQVSWCDDSVVGGLLAVDGELEQLLLALGGHLSHATDMN